MHDSMTRPADVIAFWQAAGPARWFKSDAAFDADFRDQFLATHVQAAAGELAAWEQSAEGALALVLLLDQFPRNAFRGTPRVYDTDALARDVARRAIEAGHDRAVDPALRGFFYLPFQHSESLADQDFALALATAMDGGDAEKLKWVRHHHAIIQRFGRFPHRNEILKRESTAAELRFLQGGGFRG